MRYPGVLLFVIMMVVPALAEETEITGAVARSTFTTQIVEREPADEIVTATNDTDIIYHFSEIQGMSGQVVRHRWFYEGELKAEVSFDIGGPRWRVWSSKGLLPGWTGAWMVQVVDQVLAENSMSYEPAVE
jgi:hypothetical protein